MLWSDETKVDLSGHNDVSMFRVNGDAFKCKNTVPSVEHGGTIHALWMWYSHIAQSGWNNDEDGVPNSSTSPQIHNYCIRFKRGHICVFQQESDAKHTSKLVWGWLKQANIKLE